jgi:hypothetical protein
LLGTHQNLCHFPHNHIVWNTHHTASSNEAPPNYSYKEGLI